MRVAYKNARLSHATAVQYCMQNYSGRWIVIGVHWRSWWVLFTLSPGNRGFGATEELVPLKSVPGLWTRFGALLPYIAYDRRRNETEFEAELWLFVAVVSRRCCWPRSTFGVLWGAAAFALEDCNDLPLNFQNHRRNNILENCIDIVGLLTVQFSREYELCVQGKTSTIHIYSIRIPKNVY